MLTNLANYPAADSPRRTYSKNSAKLETTPTVLQKRVFKKILCFTLLRKNVVRYKYYSIGHSHSLSANFVVLAASKGRVAMI